MIAINNERLPQQDSNDLHACDEINMLDELYVNQALAKEFIESHLSISATPEHIDALAHFIFQLEHNAEISTPDLGNKKNSKVNVFYINQKESTHD